MSSSIIGKYKNQPKSYKYSTTEILQKQKQWGGFNTRIHAKKKEALYII